MTYSHEDYLIQLGLKKEGFNLVADGYKGKITRKLIAESASNRYLTTPAKATKLIADGYPPAPTPRNKSRVFGRHGIKNGFTPPMVKVVVPFEMHLYKETGRIVKTITCHQLIATPLSNFLTDLYKQLGDSGIKKYGFHLWFGCYAPRRSRGGSGMSDHAWAIAIDWNAHANGNHQNWSPDKKMPNGTHQFSKKVVSIARKHGFQVGFVRNNGKRQDMMHFAYVNRN